LYNSSNSKLLIIYGIGLLLKEGNAGEAMARFQRFDAALGLKHKIKTAWRDTRGE